jgi:polysaccharide deacetylase 2 family uncharacterized protein YibQ
MLNIVICRWRLFFVAISCVTLFFYVSPAFAQKQRSNEPHKKQVAIVIDDFGNNMTGTAEMMALNIQFTAAVMPFLPTTHHDAEWAHSLGHNVLVHLPMEPIHGKSSWLGPGAITTSLSDDEIRKRVNAAIDDVPHAVGMNNHMGSKVTADPRVMQVVLEVCRERGLFFLDSRTNHKSVVTKLSNQIGVRTLNNQIFLDENYTMQHIRKQISQMNTHLLKNDECIVIGHVGPPGKKTAEALNQISHQITNHAEFISLLQMLAVKEHKKN